MLLPRHAPLHRSSWKALLAFVSLVLLAAPAQADLKSYLTLTINGTQIDGDVDISPHEGKIEVDALSVLGFASVDGNGMVRGPEHRPITILKPLDRATPLLWKAWANQEQVDAAIIELYRPNSSGAEENYFTIQFTGGRVSSVATNSPDSLTPEGVARPATELVTFTYSTITWTSSEGTIFTDTWGGGS